MDVTVQEVSAEVRGGPTQARTDQAGGAQHAMGPADRDRMVALEIARRERHKHRLEAY